MHRNRIPGSLKAAYIFSLMPHAIRAYLMNRFSSREQEKLNDALQHLNTIPLAGRRAILRECISRLEHLRKRREQQLESSLILSMTVIAALVISSFVYAQIVLRTFIIIMALTVGPLTEEIFFRYFLFLQSGRRYGYLLCGLVSSLLFAAVHLPGSFLIFLKYLLCGVLLCGICYFRKSVFPALCAHAIANLTVIIM